jgi:ferritin
MFTPVGAFVQAVLMMYNTIMFFVEKIKEIFAWVKSITSSINALYEHALNTKDLPSQIVLQWFINEQVEEEALVMEIIERLKLVGSDGPSIYLLDRQMATRPSAPTGQ